MKKENIIKMIFQLSYLLDIEEMKIILKDFRDDFSRYEAIGFVEGYQYLDKLERKKAELERLSSLVKLIEVLKNTNHLFEENNENINNIQN